MNGAVSLFPAGLTTPLQAVRAASQRALPDCGQARPGPGGAFDLKAFHEVLRQGAMPLVVLERVVLASA